MSAAPLSVRFWAKVEKSSGCWVWTGSKQRQGYGIITLAGRQLSAHRVSWELHYGPIPDGLHVCHRCDNPPCVRPDHLFTGTNQENMLDMVAKGRAWKGVPKGTNPGEKNPSRKLTSDQVTEMRSRFEAGGVRQAALGREYGVSAQQVGRILRREKWSHL